MACGIDEVLNGFLEGLAINLIGMRKLTSKNQGMPSCED